MNRFHEDSELYNELASANFQGDRWQAFAYALAQYGHAVVKAWLVTGEMFVRCKRKGCYPGPAPGWWSEEDRDALANETVATALVSFRNDALIGGRWSPEGGASLKTYFIGSCVLAFPNVFRTWSLIGN